MDGLRSALDRAGVNGSVLVAEASDVAPAYFCADKARLVPRASDPAYVDELLRLCDQLGVGLVVPTIDTELTVLAASRERFSAQGVMVSVSAPRAVQIASDKRMTHEWLTELGAPTVEQWGPSNVTDSTFVRHQRLLVKPRTGSMSKGVRLVRDPSELDENEDVVIQAIAEGVEYTASTYVTRSGRCLEVVPRERIEVRAGEVSKGRTRRMPALEAHVRRIAEGLPGAFGPLNVQAFCGSEGAPAIIEINCRFGGGDPLAWAAGADFPYALVLEALGRTPDPIDYQWSENVLMLRFDRAVYKYPDGTTHVG